MIQNPIIPGFHPDPSFCRVGDDYYIVNSTFEWFPGVPVHHSRDLKNWRCIGHILTRRSQLDLRGVVDSGGVWAPSLSHADGKFWLIYTNLRNTGMGRPFKDIKIFLTTADDILGPWSDPIELDSIGFDPSLFHDDDGRKYLLNMEWDFRKGHYRFSGIVLQEYAVATSKLIGERVKILHKDQILTEGPNLYKHGGWYYLMLAEGGTGWNHGISMARSRNLLGPYELDPQPSVITTRHDESWPLQKAGHGEIVETQHGEWFMAHLASRPIGERRCTLGRETILQRVIWQDGWLRFAHGDVRPLLEIEEPVGLSECQWPEAPARDGFDAPTLDVSWSSLRVPMAESWLSLTARPGWLRLIGRDSLHSFFDQSLVAKRLQRFHIVAETCVDFQPAHFTQMAGLIFYYNTRFHYYLRITHHEERGRIVGVVLTDNGAYDELEESELVINDWGLVHLRANIDEDKLQFSASPDGEAWHAVGPVLDASKISDDYANGFTGAMVGICAQDLSGNRKAADFDWFELKPNP
ncbi:MAG: glycoside hydrolase family 43 protein [Luteolibacter sp.]|uniref:glycoside hydrolase family 43 protein n=1 Tax=Luteolibacter sp. TaxID=1962973 RepID=UPI003263C29D